MLITRIIPALVLSVLLGGSAAHAVSLLENGKIQSIDAAKHQIVLANGDTFQVPSKLDVKKLMVGEKVTISYVIQDGKKVASEVKGM